MDRTHIHHVFEQNAFNCLEIPVDMESHANPDGLDWRVFLRGTCSRFHGVLELRAHAGVLFPMTAQLQVEQAS